jgi:hypothetical protein
MLLLDLCLISSFLIMDSELVSASFPFLFILFTFHLAQRLASPSG